MFYCQLRPLIYLDYYFKFALLEISAPGASDLLTALVLTTCGERSVGNIVKDTSLNVSLKLSENSNESVPDFIPLV